MAKTVVIDSGAIVAALRRRDQHHAWVRAHFEAETEPFVTCEAVVSESFFLLERARGGKVAGGGKDKRAVLPLPQITSTIPQRVGVSGRKRLENLTHPIKLHDGE